MLLRVRPVLGRLIAVLCLLATAGGTSAMVLRQTTEGHGPGRAESRHHSGEHHPRPDHRTDGCCDLCFAGCQTPPRPPAPAVLPAVIHTNVPHSLPHGAGQLRSALRVHHRLPFAQGPPAFLS